MKLSPAGRKLLAEFEGCRLRAYRDSVGVWTVGYGLTSAAGIIKVGPGTTITQEQADEFLTRALVQYEQAVLRAITKPMNQNEFDAMVCLCYNIGTTGFARSSVVRYFNAGDKSKAGRSFALWCKGGGKVIKGLVRRREAEIALFLTPVADKPTDIVAPVAGEKVVVAVADDDPDEGVEVSEPVIPVRKPLGFWAWLKSQFFS